MTPDQDRLGKHWLVGCESSQVSKSAIGVTVLGTPLVIYRPSGGIVVAEDRCPHRNAPLSHGFVQAGMLRCPYHGWGFGAEGRCVDAPGGCAGDLPNVSLNRWQAQESDGWIWVAKSGDITGKSFYRPEVANATRYRGFNMTAELDSNLADAIENLLDGTHTPYVHSGLVRSSKAKQSFTALVRRHDGFVEAEYRGEAKQNGFISKWFEPDRKVSFGRFFPPCTAELEYRSKRRTELQVVVHFTPTSAGKLRVFVRCYLPNGRLPASWRYAVVKPFFRKVLDQDQAILRLQQWNIARFGKPGYTNWRADLLRPWIDAWLASGEFPPQPNGPHEVTFWL
jgi:phenylpropionate dioxygenase-like ring-hydroxylating dioxygenase large terminal subunit